MIAGVMLILAGLLVDVFVFTPVLGIPGGMLPVAVIFTVACAFIALRVVAVIRLSRSIELGLPVRHNPTAAPTISYSEPAPPPARWAHSAGGCWCSCKQLSGPNPKRNRR